MDWSRPSVCLSACLISQTTGWIRMKCGTGVVPSGWPPNRTVPYSKNGINKTADEEICEVVPTGGALWWPKSEPRLKLKSWLEVYHPYHSNRGKQYYNLYCCQHCKPSRLERCCTLVDKVWTMPQVKTMAGVIRIFYMVTMANSSTILKIWVLKLLEFQTFETQLLNIWYHLSYYWKSYVLKIRNY
jgi:hypothetical protein